MNYALVSEFSEYREFSGRRMTGREVIPSPGNVPGATSAGRKDDSGSCPRGHLQYLTRRPLKIFPFPAPPSPQHFCEILGISRDFPPPGLVISRNFLSIKHFSISWGMPRTASTLQKAASSSLAPVPVLCVCTVLPRLLDNCSPFADVSIPESPGITPESSLYNICRASRGTGP